MTKDEALKLAQIALDDIEHQRFSWRRFDALVAIKQALAQPEQEPVARVIDNGTPEGATEWIPFANRVEPLETGDLLYTTPPQRPWVGLTGQEKAWIASVSLDTHDAVYRTDVKLKEKNT